MSSEFREIQEGETIRSNSLETLSGNLPMVPEPVRLNDEQAYMFAAAIASAAKTVDYDPNYGCGAERAKRTETVRVSNLRKEECLGLLQDKYNGVLEFSKDMELTEIQRVSLEMVLKGINEQIMFIETLPDNTLIKIPEEEAINVELEVGSQLDRKYWTFVDRIIRDSRVRRVSPSIAAEYGRLRKELFVPSPTLCLNSGLYAHLKKEFSFIRMLDSPRAFQGLLDLANEEDGREGIYYFLTGRKIDHKIIKKLDYIAQRFGGVIGLPNQFIEGR